MPTLSFKDPQSGKQFDVPVPDGVGPDQYDGLVQHVLSDYHSSQAPTPLPKDQWGIPGTPIRTDADRLGGIVSRPVVSGNMTVATFGKGGQRFYDQGGQPIPVGDPRVRAYVEQGNPTNGEMIKQSFGEVYGPGGDLDNAFAPGGGVDVALGKLAHGAGEINQAVNAHINPVNIASRFAQDPWQTMANPYNLPLLPQSSQPTIPFVQKVAKGAGEAIGSAPGFMKSTMGAVGANIAASMSSDPEVQKAAKAEADQFVIQGLGLKKPLMAASAASEGDYKQAWQLTKQVGQDVWASTKKNPGGALVMALGIAHGALSAPDMIRSFAADRFESSAAMLDREVAIAKETGTGSGGSHVNIAKLQAMATNLRLKAAELRGASPIGEPTGTPGMPETKPEETGEGEETPPETAPSLSPEQPMPYDVTGKLTLPGTPELARQPDLTGAVALPYGEVPRRPVVAPVQERAQVAPAVDGGFTATNRAGYVGNFPTEAEAQKAAAGQPGTVTGAAEHARALADANDAAVANSKAAGDQMAAHEAQMESGNAPAQPKPMPITPINNAADFATAIKTHFGLSEDEANANIAIGNARAKAWANLVGSTPDTWFKTRFAAIGQGGLPDAKAALNGSPGVQAQDLQGSVEFLNDNRAIIRALNKPDVTTPAHEMFHVFRRDMYREGGVSPEDQKAVEEWAGVKNGNWTPRNEDGTFDTSAEEKWSRGFERFLADGVAPNDTLRRVFSQFREWMLDIYRGVIGAENEFEGRAIGEQVPDHIKEIYKKLLASGEEEAKPAAPVEPAEPGIKMAGAPQAEEKKARQSGAEYAGSINLNKLSDDELKAAYTKRATDLGYDNQEPLTRQAMKDQSRALGLTTEALGRMPIGWKPGNVHTGVWMDAVRDVDDQAHVAEKIAKNTYRDDPTEENKAALDKAKAAADATFQRRSALAREWGQSGQVLKSPSDPFTAAKEGDLFRQDERKPVVKKGLKRKSVEEKVNSPEFGSANTRYTKADTDAALARIQARFKDVSKSDMADCAA